MSFSPPSIDPYQVLGVRKDATLSEIKAAHRKLVLKCHPDKIKDESLRSQAQDEFQRVQQAYEVLSDETRRIRYDQKARLAELRKEAMERSGGTGTFPYASPRGSGSSSTREYRDGRFYEERVPADARFFEDDIPFTEEPHPSSRKYDDYGKRQRPKGADEKKRPKPVPSDSYRSAKEYTRETLRATHSDRAKHRTKERRREFSDKYDRTAPHLESDDDDDSGSDTSYYVKLKRPAESRRSRDTSSRTKPDASPRQESRRHNDDDYSDEWKTKHEYLQTTARDYISRSKANPPIEVDRRARPSRSPAPYAEYESADREQESSRRSARSHSRRDSGRPTSSGKDHRGSYEHLASQSKSYERKVPSMPTATSAPAGIKPPSSSKPPPQPTRSSTATYSRQKRDPTGRSEPTLLNMVPPLSSGASRSSKVRNAERYDSGYSSPGTPEMHQSSSPPKSSSVRYKIVEDEPEPIVVEPDMSSYRHQRSTSPVRPDRPSIIRPSVSGRAGSKPTRTYTYSPEASIRHETARPANSRAASSRPLFAEYDLSGRFKERDVKYAREIRPNDIKYTPEIYPRPPYDDHPAVGRRQSAY